jgi:tRNA threonylcarbamoyl adenosine modification protein (Sua5/YciO/YrdC/YwlC family)
MSPVIDCTSDAGRDDGVAQATEAVQRGELVVLPTDTVYGIGADAFDAEAVAALLAAKGRGREMPPPVLVPNPRTVDGLATAVPSYARDLIKAFWPGALTLVLKAQRSLMWDLGETNGTVAVRMPQDDVALTLLAEVGPMAVSSANVTGQAAAQTVTEAAAMLGSSVSVYLAGGPARGTDASTILDCTRENPVVLRVGAISSERLREVLGDVLLDDPFEIVDEPESEQVEEDAPEAVDEVVDEPESARADTEVPEAANEAPVSASDEDRETPGATSA